MTRTKHYLIPNRASRRPSRLAFLDVDVSQERLVNGDIRETFGAALVASARRRRGRYAATSGLRLFTSRSTLWDYLEQQTGTRSRVLVCCPNPVRVLTLLHHVTELQARGWTLDMPVSSPRFSAISWRRAGRTLLFVAHGNLFPMQRLSSGEARTRVLEMLDTWVEYLWLLDEIDAGDFHLSLGAQASGIYRHRFLQHPILVHANRDVDNLERRATFGAIYQPYWFGLAPADTYCYLDTNSMYPWIMKIVALPWRLAGHGGQIPVDTLSEKLITHDAVATVYLKTDVPHYPLRLADRTVYPVGEFTTTLTTPDLRFACDLGHVREVYAAAFYDRARLFDQFVSHFWSLRKRFDTHGKPMWAKWCKAIMNALYGRFGAHEFETRSEGNWYEDTNIAGQWASVDRAEVRWFHTLAGKMWSSGECGLHRDAFPAIMAHVAAYARERMLALAEQAGWKNVFVIISDGLIVNQAGYERLQHEVVPDQIGALRLKLTGEELQVWSDVEFRLAAKTWRPGVKAGAVEVDDGVFVEYREPGLVTLARSGTPEDYVKRRTEIRLARSIRSGQVTETGQIVPLEIHEPPLPQPRSALIPR